MSLFSGVRCDRCPATYSTEPFWSPRNVRYLASQSGWTHVETYPGAEPIDYCPQCTLKEAGA